MSMSIMTGPAEKEVFSPDDGCPGRFVSRKAGRHRIRGITVPWPAKTNHPPLHV